jgi:hypothetical protein
VSLYAEGYTDKAKENECKKGNKQYPEKVSPCNCREEEMPEIRF